MPPPAPLPPLLSAKHSPATARHLPPPALTNSFPLARVPAGDTVRDGSPSPPPLPAFPTSGLAVSLQIRLSTEAGDSGRPCAGGVLVGSAKVSLSSCLASIHLLCPAWGEGLVPPEWAAGSGRWWCPQLLLGTASIQPALTVSPPPWTNMGQRMGVGPPAWVLPVPVPAPSCPRVPLPRLLLSKGNIPVSSGGDSLMFSATSIAAAAGTSCPVPGA